MIIEEGQPAHQAQLIIRLSVGAEHGWHGGNEVEIDASFSDLIEVLNAAISARFESHKGRWGYFLDGMYTKLNPKQNTPIGDLSVAPDAWFVARQLI